MLKNPALGRSWAGVLMILVFLGPSGCKSRGSGSSEARGTVRFDAAAAAALSKGLVSGDEAQVRKVVAVPTGVALPPAVVSQFAALRIAVDPGSFVLRKDGTGTAKAKVGSAEWDVALVLVDGIWKLSATTLATR